MCQRRKDQNLSTFVKLPVGSSPPALFRDRGKAHFTQTASCEHGRIETRRIWCSSALNDHADFPHVGQVFLIERERIEKKTGKWP